MEVEFMTGWVKGNIPEDKNGYYWVAIEVAGDVYTYDKPFRFSEKENTWIDFDGAKLSLDSAIAYYQIVQPRSYTMIGNGCGYYLQTYYKEKKLIYGKRLCLASLGGDGYNDIEKAKIALRNMKKQDIKLGNYVRDVYEIVNGNGKVVWTLRN
jgi:hypothetical protein